MSAYLQNSVDTLKILLGLADVKCGGLALQYGIYDPEGWTVSHFAWLNLCPKAF